ncbi:MAG: patatin-like phospholipase family protein [Bacteroidales bacterium]|nr:patatin-like phospholipase family protein [Bacteroidales bacterium]
MKKFVCSLLLMLAFSIGAISQDFKLRDDLSFQDSTAWNNFRSRLDKIRKERPTVALVLGGGGARGLAHVGVLRYLKEQNIPVDLVVGTSMGGLMGSLFALGYPMNQIEEIVKEMDWEVMLSDKIPDKFISYRDREYREKYRLRIPFDINEGKFQKSMPSAYIKGQNVSNLISSMTVGYQNDMDFSEFPIPFACVATDLIRGVGHIWLSGNINDALRTTMSIPVVFSPLRKDQMVLIDGGLKDNYPVDIARAMGADIVIGVSVGTPSKDFNETANVMDVVSQVIDLSDKVNLEKNMKLGDVNIVPELDGYTALSFSRENVETIIEKGYEAAASNAAGIAAVKDRAGSGGVRYNAPSAINVSRDKIHVDSIHFKGINDQEEKILLRKMHFKSGQMVGREELDNSVQQMYAFNSFHNIQYRIPGSEGKKDMYNIVMDCRKGPVNQFGLGGRFDSEELVSAFVNLEINSHSLYGSSYDFNLKLAANPNFRFEYFYDHPNAPMLGVAVELGYTNTHLMSYSDSPFSMDFFYTTQEATISDLHWSVFDLRGGVRNKYVKILNYNPLVNNEKRNPHNFDRRLAQDGLWANPTDYLGLFLNAGMDKMEGSYYFPTGGYAMNLDYDWQFKASLKRGEDFRNFNYHALAFKFRAAVSSSFFTYLPSLATRLLFSKDHENIPLYALNVIGGRIPSRYLPQQMTFTGINNLHAVNDMMLLMAHDFRFTLFPKNYITLQTNLVFSADKLWGPYVKEDFFKNHLDLGIGVEYAVETIIGPVKVGLDWSNSRLYNRYKGFGANISIGCLF